MCVYIILYIVHVRDTLTVMRVFVCLCKMDCSFKVWSRDGTTRTNGDNENNNRTKKKGSDSVVWSMSGGYNMVVTFRINLYYYDNIVLYDGFANGNRLD